MPGWSITANPWLGLVVMVSLSLIQIFSKNAWLADTPQRVVEVHVQFVGIVG
jgi:hypothetical protein